MSIKSLTTLEENIMSPRMDFPQEKQHGYKIFQIGFIGTIINVQVQVQVQVALLRSLIGSMKIVVMIKRKL